MPHRFSKLYLYNQFHSSLTPGPDKWRISEGPVFCNIKNIKLNFLLELIDDMGLDKVRTTALMMGLYTIRLLGIVVSGCLAWIVKLYTVVDRLKQTGVAVKP